MKVAVVGSGIMGLGITQAFAQTDGYEVNLCVVSGKGFEQKQRLFEKPLKRMVEKGRITQERFDDIVSRVKITDLEGAKDCDLVIESAIENMQAKVSVLKQLEKICRPDALLASNTSSLSITELSSELTRPIIGMHFFNPAAVMKLVEVIPGMTTTEEMVEQVKDIAISIDKVPVEVIEGPGFVVNRLLIPMINEAIGIYEEGLATVEGIDIAMKLGANHPMGPLALGDLIGLDVCLAIMEVMFHETLDSKYRPSRLLKKMVRAKHLGQKAGKGFYEYDERGRIIPGTALDLRQITD
ncbi:MAG: 3-hydroxyacyl-CoA dehydrogenase NAD-binding domain-containing protein [Eubacteriales bacterium]|nr:3-hydroxyacyl-CoA dehydrogenase NAD-binding domain-containing protein [Eubacteriales bacterium]